MGKQRLGISLQIAGSPEARLRERGIQGVTHDHHLAAVELTNRGGDDMHKDRLAASGPLHLHRVRFAQPSNVVAELLPAPSLWRRLIGHAQEAIALHACGDEKAPVARRTPQTLGTIPTIQQDVRQGSGHRLKAADERFHLLNLALECHTFPLAGRFLSIQLGSQGTAAVQQDIQSYHQAMADDAFVLGGRVVPAQSFHLLPFRFAHHRVIPDHRSCFERPRRFG